MAHEFDATFFHLYGISRDDTADIMDTFPIVKKNDEKEASHDLQSSFDDEKGSRRWPERSNCRSGAATIGG